MTHLEAKIQAIRDAAMKTATEKTAAVVSDGVESTQSDVVRGLLKTAAMLEADDGHVSEDDVVTLVNSITQAFGGVS